MLRIPFEGKNVKILVLNRPLAEHYKPTESAIIISITEDMDHSVVFDYNSEFKAILRLYFYDLEQPIPGCEKANLFSSDDAKQILEFVDNNIDEETKMIIVHCEAGLSRSAGVAAALSLIMNEDCEFFHKNYYPNSLVKSTILRQASFYGNE